MAAAVCARHAAQGLNSRAVCASEGVAVVSDVASALLDLPGGDLVESGLEDLAAERETVAALLVASFSTRLRRLGLDVPPCASEEPEMRLYGLLQRDLGDGAHARYQALIERLDSFANSYSCVNR